MPDQSEKSADLIAKLKALPPAERSQGVIDWLARLEALPADTMALSAASRLNSCLTPILADLQMMAIGVLGSLPEPAMKSVITMLRFVQEARDVYFVLIDGIHRLAPGPPDSPDNEECS